MYNENACSGCKYSDSGGTKNKWLGIGEFLNVKHPSEFKNGSISLQIAASKRTKNATKKENDHIKVSKNSGRRNRDGDYTTDNCLYDYKYQDAKDVTIRMSDVDKAKADAIRNSKSEFALVIENKDGRKFEVREL